jgi:hypothetical protein
MGDFGCGACYEGEPKVAWDHVSHGPGAGPKIAGDYAFEVRVTRCPTCGQAFLFIHYREVTWATGEFTVQRDIWGHG